MAGRRKRKVEKDLLVESIKTAFEAAMHLWAEWESPDDGPVVVVDVCPASAVDDKFEPVPHFSGWWITYRVIKTWGKEAWNRGYRET